MKKIFVAAFFISCNMFFAQNQYVFFLHNKFLEEHSAREAHPEHGICEYPQIISAFKKEGFTVISEIRPKNTNTGAYASKVVRQIDSLIRLGIKPGYITVVGTSKGGYIAKEVSRSLRNEEVNYAFIGSCDENEAGSFYGNILSIYEESDNIGRSCGQIKDNSKTHVKHFKELRLETGLKHGFLFKASPLWLEPCFQWAKGNYN